MENQLTTVPDDIIERWSIGRHGVLFQRKGGSFWMHGKLGHNISKKSGNDIIRTKPVKLDWLSPESEIMYSNEYIIFKTNDTYYAVGGIPWGERHTDKPVKLPIDDVVRVFADAARIFVCTSDECFAAGCNMFGMLGINDSSVKWQRDFIKVNWYPIEIIFDEFTLDIKMKNEKWYGIGQIDQLFGYNRKKSFVEPPCAKDARAVWYPKELSNQIDCDERLHTIKQMKCDYDLCPRCRFDTIDMNVIHNGIPGRQCLLCHYEMGHLSGKDERRALWKLRHLEQDDLPTVRSFLTGIFEPLKDDLKDFNEKLTCFNIDDLILAVKFEHRLLVKRLIHDKLLDYMHPWFMDVAFLKEDKYATNELPLEPNDLGALDWRGCDAFHKMNFINLIDKVNNKEKIKLLDISTLPDLDTKLTDLYEFITNLPNLEIIIIGKSHKRDAFNKIIKKVQTLRKHHETPKKITFSSPGDNIPKCYTYNYFPNYPKHFLYK